MQQLALWLVAARHRALIFAVLFAIVAISVSWAVRFLPLLGMLSAAGIAIPTIRRGYEHGLLVAIAAAAIIAVLDVAWNGQVGGVSGYIFACWVAVLLLGALFRRWGSLSLCLQVITAGTLLLVLASFLVAGDPMQAWSEVVEQRLLPSLKAAGWPLDVGIVPAIALWLPGMLAGLLLLSAVLGFLLALWWLSLLPERGSFAAHFATIRLGRSLGIFATIVFVGGGLVRSPLLDNWVLVLISAFLFQGLAVLHQMRQHGRLARGWLVGVYVMLVLLALPTAVGLAGFGFVDNWLDLRRHVSKTR